ncbi:transcriptional regulator [Streptomyces luteireticuli]|uniref:Winged helix DNA-binding domain-containing protein n=1 Tax=Streptomyces luteireticuli TaxID=173858 RepID=A0ABN0YFG4_9ACTN
MRGALLGQVGAAAALRGAARIEDAARGSSHWYVVYLWIFAAVGKAEFGYVRDLVEVTDSVLSKQAAALEEAGWIAVEKGRVGRQPRTWLAVTDEGLAVYRRHLDALRDIAG